MQAGKYYLEHSGNVKQPIERTGKLPTRFKPNGSGFFTSKQRYEEAKADPSCLHFMPDLAYKRHKSLYTPITDKFMGYSQFPYQADLPEHLEVSHQKAAKIVNFEKNQVDSSGLRLLKPHRQGHRRHLTRRRPQPPPIAAEPVATSANYFELSMSAMAVSRPPPHSRKKSCYDDRCRLIDHIKRFSMES